MINKHYKFGKLYLGSWSTQLIRVHTIVASHEVAVRQVEQLVESSLDLGLLYVVPVHPGQVLASLVLVHQVHSPLARHDTSAEEVADHTRPIHV